VALALVDHGRLQGVRLLAAGGDWHCARVLARALVTRGETDAALAVVRPFADHGHWEAVECLAGILDRCDRTDEAIGLVRRHLAAGGPYGTTRLAALLARQGRTDEVIELLRPHLADPVYAQALIVLTAGTGHDDQVATLLRDRIRAEQHQARRWPYLPSNTETLLAVVLERQNRVDDAVALLRARLRDGDASADHVDQLAEILAGHAREAELRLLAAETDGERVACRLAVWLEKQDRVDEAVTTLWPLANSDSPDATAVLAGLLARHDRADEAVEVLRAGLTTTPDVECLLALLCDLLISLGRPDEAVAAIEDVAAHHGGMWLELRVERCRVLARCGRIEEAITAVRNDPDSPYLTRELADLLVEAGRPQEAIAVLRRGQQDPWNTTRLAELLIQQGQVTDAIEPFRAKAAARQKSKAKEDAAFWHQFRAGNQLQHTGTPN
jgi:thioredoxin-like negative regulator of GroEL